MKNIVITTLLTGFLTSMLFAHGGNSQDDKMQMMKNKKNQMQNNHMGDHMHNGEMMNHGNPKGMTDKKMQMIKHNN